VVVRQLSACCPAVEHAFEKPSPTAVLVRLVDDEPAGHRQLAAEDALAIPGHVPVEVAHARARKRPGQRRLPDLSRPRDEDHLAPKVTQDLRCEVPAADRHAWRDWFFHLRSKTPMGIFDQGRKSASAVVVAQDGIPPRAQGATRMQAS